MIPDLIEIDGAPWGVLPSGIHTATLDEVAKKFANNHHRRKLFKGLVEAAKSLKQSGCKRIFLDGSFVTGKPKPNDYDGCWDPDSVNPKLLDPVFLDFSNSRMSQKQKYHGEMFPFGIERSSGKHFVEFFQVERFTGKSKGIVEIDLTIESFNNVEGV
jgi:hypothetical protein